MAIPLAEADKVAKLVPEPIQGKSPPIAEAIEKEPRLKALYDENAEYRELLDMAKGLEGLNRHAGMHAAGVVIGEKPLWEYVPCFQPGRRGRRHRHAVRQGRGREGGPGQVRLPRPQDPHRHPDLRRSRQPRAGRPRRGAARHRR